MTDRPIIFSGPMIRALLDGRKMQTRRVLKPQPREGARYTGIHYASDEPDSWFFNTVHGGQKVRAAYDEGDRLWVRESISILPRTAYALPKTQSPDPDMAAYYQADFDRSGKPRWRPSIHMPRWASRLTLIVTDVRVQRLREITPADALAEGVEMESADPPFYYVPGIWPHSITAVGVEEPGGRHAERSFAKLWDSLNADRGYGWEANPWVVALTFTVHQQNIDSIKEAAA